MEGDSLHGLQSANSGLCAAALRTAQAVLKDTRAAGDAESSGGSSLAAGEARALLCLASTAAEELPG